MSAREAHPGKRAGDAEEAGSKKTKRTRVSLACCECRKKKERCDGGQPVCESCRLQNRRCYYDTSSKKRGLPVGYVRGVENLLGLILHAVPGCEDAVLAILRGQKQIRRLADKDSSNYYSLTDVWRTSSTCKEMDKVLSQVHVNEDDDATARDLHDKVELAFTEALAFGGRDECETSPSPPSPPQVSSGTLNAIRTQIGEARAFPVSSCTPINAGMPPCGVSDSNGSLEPPQLPPNWSQLLDVYYAGTHCWFPVVPKNDTFRPAYILTAGSGGLTGNAALSHGDIACLWTVLAYAACSPGNQTEVTMMSNLQEGLLDLATRLSRSYETRRRETGHVQALLILALLHMARGQLSHAWSSAGEAVYLAVELSIVPSSRQWDPHHVDDRARRAFLGCFILDTIIATRLDRRPYLKSSDLRKVGMLAVDSLEEWEPWKPPEICRGNNTVGGGERSNHVPGRCLSTFNHFAELLTILNDFTHSQLESSERSSSRDATELNAGKHAWLFQQDAFLGQAISDAVPRQNPCPQSLNLILASTACIAVVTAEETRSETITNRETQAHLPKPPASINKILEVVCRDMHKNGPILIPPLCAVYVHIIARKCCGAPPDITSWKPPDGHAHDLALLSTIQTEFDRAWLKTGLMTQATIETERCSANNTFRDASTATATLTVGTATRESGQGPLNPRTDYPGPNITAQNGTGNNLGAVGVTHQYVMYPAAQTVGITKSMTRTGNFQKVSVNVVASADSRSLAGPLGDGGGHQPADDYSAASLTSDTTQSGDDLFSSLTRLDAIDRAGSNQEFMEHLGVFQDMDPLDFQALFTA